jgi:DNA invertase Pin-like site-specific DNA recombinase
MSSNAAIYARVSSARQKEQETIGSQTAALRTHAAQLGLDVAEQWVFCDDGHSGASLVRPALERLRDLVCQVPVDVLLVYSPDRLARKYAYQALLIEEFAKAGTSVVFVKGPRGDSPEDALLVQFQGMIAEYERAQILERTRRGKTHRAKAGTINVLSGAPFGYRYVRKTEHAEARYEIVAHEAAILAELFARYADGGVAIAELTRWMNTLEVATRTGKTPGAQELPPGDAVNVVVPGRAPPQAGSAGSCPPRHPVPQTHELAMDPPVAPARVFLREPGRELADLLRYSWSAGLVGVAPMSRDQSTMPAEQRARGDQPVAAQLPRRQARQRSEHRPVRPIQPGPRDLPAQHGDLVAQHQDLLQAAEQDKPTEEPHHHRIEQTSCRRPSPCPTSRASKPQATEREAHIGTAQRDTGIEPVTPTASRSFRLATCHRLSALTSR